MDIKRGRASGQTTLKAIVGEFEAEEEPKPQYPINFATLEDQMNNTCRHCGLYRQFHVDDHCLFDSLLFEPRTWKMELEDMAKELYDIKEVQRKKKR